MYMMDNVDAARRELQKALDYGHEQGNAFTAYLAALLLGRISEDKREFQAALDAYRLATREYPSGQVARMACGRLLAAQGHREAGWAAVREGLTMVDTKSGSDPWYHFVDGTTPWQFSGRLAELRQLVRR
jgi:tetratricopeptide (TPR) repeat protein